MVLLYWSKASVYIDGLCRPAMVGWLMDPIARLALPRAAMAWKTAFDARLIWSACSTQPFAGDIVSRGPAMRKRKKSNALRSTLLMQNCAMDGGAISVRPREDTGDDFAVRSSELPAEETQSSSADGLLEAGRRGLGVAVRLDSDEM